MTPLATMSLLRSRNGVLTKSIRRTGQGWHVTGFSDATWYAVHERNVASFDEMAALLPQVAADPHCAIVRGRLRDGVDPKCCRRLCDRTKHGDAITFLPALCRWLALVHSQRRSCARLAPVAGGGDAPTPLCP